MFGLSSIPGRLATATSRLIYSLLTLGLAVLAAGCSSLSPRDFAADAPSFDPARFFTGPTHSWGVFENRAGQPSRRFRTAGNGKWKGSVLVLDQTFTYDDGQTQRRRWRIRRLNAHHYAATADDVAGPATGEAYGNVFHWAYTVQLKPGNLLFDIRLEQWMYLQTDGTVLNRGTIKKLGILLAQVSEHFSRGDRLSTSPRQVLPEFVRHTP